MMTKTCTRCKATRNVEDFHSSYNNIRRKSYRVGMCKECRSAHRKERGEHAKAQPARVKRYQSDPEYRRKLLSGQHKSRYGITLDEKDAMLAAQGGVCACCGTDEPKGRGWATDHNHACCPGIRSCGKCIRGVICSRCNMALGQFDDDPEKLRSAIAYLERTSGQ